MRGDWDFRTIGDVCDLATGGTPSRTRTDFFGGDIPWLVSGDINQREITECEGRITVSGSQSCNTKRLPKDSVMIALNGQGKTRATVAMLRMEGATCNQSLVCISPKDRTKLLPEFVFANLDGRYEELRRLTSDDDKDRRGLNMGIIRNIRIPVPPIKVQRRIVAILDEAFAGIATAKTNAEQSLRNAREVFDGELREVFSARRSGWLDTTIGAQVLLQRGFDITKDQQTIGDVPVVSSGGIKSYHNVAMVRGPGVVMGRKGTLGKVFYLERDYWPHDTTLWVKDFKRNNPRLVYYFFSGLDVTGLDSGAANPALNRNQIHPLRVCWPPLAEQKTIVTRLDKLAQETKNLEAIYARKLATLDDLRQSILHQAFSGQL